MTSLYDLAILPASPSHHQPQLSQGQHPSTGRGISRNALELSLCSLSPDDNRRE